jgi:DNA polymerase-4
MDCDAFYASVEKRDRPELRDQPVIVGGGVRGVVTTACYIARLSGVRSAMPMFKARKLCPDAVIISPNIGKYRIESRRILDKLRRLTPLVQPLSLDEAWADLSGTERLHGAAPAVMLARLQSEIECEIGLTVSIGLASNRFLAKIASDLDKPRGFALIDQEEAQDFLAPMPASRLPGVGAVFARSLDEAGLGTIGDIARTPESVLRNRFGARGSQLARLARGEDDRSVDPDQERKSISAETTFDHDLVDLTDLERRLRPLCERVARRARTDNLVGTAVTLKLRDAEFRILTRRTTLPRATQTARTLFSVASQLLKTQAPGRTYRLIGVGLSNLVDSDRVDTDLFSSDETRARWEEAVVDKIRARFGPEAVINGRDVKARSSGRRAD